MARWVITRVQGTGDEDFSLSHAGTLLKLRGAWNHLGLVSLHSFLNTSENLGICGGNITFLGGIATEMKEQFWFMLFGF